MITAVPAPLTPYSSLRRKTSIAARPRYASVLPPPVGNQMRSTRSRSACPSSTVDASATNKKPSWKGRHSGSLGVTAAAKCRLTNL